MSEDWRRKKYYAKRVLIETERVLDSPFPEAIVCLSGPQVEMLRNLTEYLHRRSTFAQDYTKTGYNAPTNADWEAISTIVADLEEKLMSSLCESLIALLEEQTTTLAAMQACLCQTTQSNVRDNAILPDMTGYVGEELANWKRPADNYGTPSTPASDAARCELAQAMYWYVYEMYTEQLLPFANNTADTLTAALVATTAFSTLALFIGWPVAVVSGVVLAVVAWGIDGSIANFTNWLWANKNEIVCVLYNKYPDYSAAASAMRGWIDSQGEISLLDKAVLKAVLGSAWHMTWVAEEQQTNDTWGDSMVVGQCDTCVPAPVGCWGILACDLDDWEGGTVTCELGRANIVGGSCWYTRNQMIVPVSGTPQLEVEWIPRDCSAGFGDCSIGLYDIDGTTVHNLLTTTTRAEDVAVSEFVNIPSSLWGKDVYLMVKQESFSAEPNYWCIDN